MYICHMTLITRIPLVEILVENSTYSSSSALRQRLVLELGWEDSCSNEDCPVQSSTWRGNPLTLQLDHINGIRTDNRIENLRILCPNCHSQTDTWCGKNMNAISKKRNKIKHRDHTTIEPSVLARISEIAPLAKKARTQHKSDDPKVLASKELNEILMSLHSEGYTLHALSDASGIAYTSVRTRIMRAKT